MDVTCFEGYQDMHANGRIVFVVCSHCRCGGAGDPVKVSSKQIPADSEPQQQLHS